MNKPQNGGWPQAVEVIFIFLITTVLCFRFTISYNEMDVLPYARAVYNPEWLSEDWYLGLRIPYRYLFSFATGFLQESIGIATTVVLGRLLSYLLFAVAYNKIARLLKLSLSARIMALAIYLIFFQYGLGDVGEWMIGGLETKVFAYSLILLSLVNFLKKNAAAGSLLAGLALSFHLLVGAYHVFCLLPLLFMYWQSDKAYAIKILKSAYLFLIAGSLGVYAIIQRFTENIDPVLANKAWDVYVQLRVNHHTLPDFNFGAWFAMVAFSAICISFLRSKQIMVRVLAGYALATVALAMVGLVIYFFFNQNLLRYYFFRTADVMLPLITILLVATLSARIKVQSYTATKARWINIGFGALIVFLIFGFITSNKTESVQKWVTAENYTAEHFLHSEAKDPELMKWVQANTEPDAVFLIPPWLKNFYITAERAVFVSWKHAPQKPYDLIEWHYRLMLLNSGEPFDNFGTMADDFHSFDDEDLARILKEYPEIDYVITAKPGALNAELLQTSRRFRLYRVR